VGGANVGVGGAGVGVGGAGVGVVRSSLQEPSEACQVQSPEHPSIFWVHCAQDGFCPPQLLSSFR